MALLRAGECSAAEGRGSAYFDLVGHASRPALMFFCYFIFISTGLHLGSVDGRGEATCIFFGYAKIFCHAPL